MKAINLGDNTYDIFDDAMKVYSELPVQSYVVRCSKTRGFFLEKYNDMEIRESKERADVEEVFRKKGGTKWKKRNWKDCKSYEYVLIKRP